MYDNPHPNVSGVKNYQNAPYDKVYMIEVFVGDETPAGQIQVAVETDEGLKVMPYPEDGEDIQGMGYLIGPPSIPDEQFGHISMGPYKSRRAAAVDAKTVVRQLLRGATGSTTKGASGADPGGTIIEMYELTDTGELYRQKKRFPPSGHFVSRKGQPQLAKARSPIVVGYAGQLGTSYPIYARLYTILPADKSKKAKDAKKRITKPFVDAWKAMGVPMKSMSKAKKATAWDSSEGYDVIPNPSYNRQWYPHHSEPYEWETHEGYAVTAHHEAQVRHTLIGLDKNIAYLQSLLPNEAIIAILLTASNSLAVEND